MKKILLFTAMIIATLSSYSQVNCDTATIYSNTSSNAVCFELLHSDNVRGCFSNNYPGAAYTSFTFGSGGVAASVTAEDTEFFVCVNPQPASYFTKILTSSTAGAGGNLTCPGYSFGVMTNGIYISPSAGIYYEDGSGVTHEEWEVEALTSNLGWDDNDAHKQSGGRYHYHGNPEQYAINQGYNNSAQHSGIIAWAADGYPVYYKYGYSDPTDNTSSIVELTSCWGVKSGDRSTAGFTDYPSGNFDGTYKADYQYPAVGVAVANCDLDSANGRWAVTPEYPAGTYHYVITSAWPYMPRYFKGSPDGSFITGPGNCTTSTADTDCGSTVYDASVHLPVELTYFRGEAKEEYNSLIWETASERNSSHFEIERSIDGRTFEMLDLIESNHFTTHTQHYSFLDFDLIEPLYYYRLKIIDQDGQYVYSNIINIVNSQSRVEIGDFQPNVTQNQTQLPIQSIGNEAVKIQIVNILGQVVQYNEYNITAGYHAISLDLNALPAQIYYVAIQVGGQLITRKIIKK